MVGGGPLPSIRRGVVRAVSISKACRTRLHGGRSHQGCPSRPVLCREEFGRRHHGGSGVGVGV